MPLEHSITHLMLYNIIFLNVLIFIATHTGQFTLKKKNTVKQCFQYYEMAYWCLYILQLVSMCVYIIIYSQLSWSKLSFFFGHT